MLDAAISGVIAAFRGSICRLWKNGGQRPLFNGRFHGRRR